MRILLVVLRAGRMSSGFGFGSRVFRARLVGGGSSTSAVAGAGAADIGGVGGAEDSDEVEEMVRLSEGPARGGIANAEGGRAWDMTTDGERRMKDRIGGTTRRRARTRVQTSFERSGGR
jgi:hypothetical protein